MNKRDAEAALLSVADEKSRAVSAIRRWKRKLVTLRTIQAALERVTK